MTTDLTARKRDARVAGLLYLLMAVAGVVSFSILPTANLVGGDSAAIIEKIASSQLLYRIGVLTDLAAQILSVFAVMALYQLLNGVNKRQAVLLVALSLVSTSMSFVNMLLGIGPLVLLSGADYLTAFDKRQLDALAMGFLSLRGYGLGAQMALFGLVLLPFGFLVFRSGFIPRILGVLLIVGCFPYLAVSVASVLFPAYARMVSRSLVLAVGEILIILWLLLIGVQTRLVEDRAC
jgi:hypothetical protein